MTFVEHEQYVSLSKIVSIVEICLGFSAELTNVNSIVIRTKYNSIDHCMYFVFISKFYTIIYRDRDLVSF